MLAFSASLRARMHASLHLGLSHRAFHAGTRQRPSCSCRRPGRRLGRHAIPSRLWRLQPAARPKAQTMNPIPQVIFKIPLGY